MMTKFGFAVVLLFTGCARQEADSVAAVQEAVFRFQFDHNAAVQLQGSTMYFLAFGDPEGKVAVDPSASFLTRFSGVKARIAPYSEAGRTDSGWVIDKKTENPGIIFFVHSVRMIGPDTAEAKGGYQQDKRSASGNTFRLKFGWRGWRVVSASMDWISRNRKPNKAPEPTTTAVTPRAIESISE